MSGLVARLPDVFGPLSRDKQLEAILSGIAGARQQGRYSGHLPLGRPIAANGRKIVRCQPRQNRPGLRTLESDQCVLVTPVSHFGSAPIVLHHPLVVGRAIGGIHTHQIALLGQTIDNNVINDAALGKTHDRILGLHDLYAGNIGDK